MAHATAVSASQETHSPLSLDTALVSANRVVEAAALTPPLAFTFRWRNLDICGQVREQDAATWLALATDFGGVPFTAENTRQRKVVADLFEMNATIPHSRFAIASDQRFLLCSEIEIPGALNGVAIVTAITTVLLQARPHIDMVQRALLAN